MKQQVGKGRTGKESMAQSRDPVSHTSIYLGSLQARQMVSTGINKASIHFLGGERISPVCQWYIMSPSQLRVTAVQKEGF